MSGSPYDLCRHGGMMGLMQRSKQAPLPPVRSEPLFAWIMSRLTTSDGVPMSVGRDTSAEIVDRIRGHANARIMVQPTTKA